MSYDTTQDQNANSSTTFVQPAGDTPPQQAIPTAPPPQAASPQPGAPATYQSSTVDAAGPPDAMSALQAADQSSGTSGTLGHPMGAAGRPAHAIDVAQSEPTPQTTKPSVDPRPYAWFSEHNPQMKDMIDQAAEATGVSPFRLAAHKWAESGKNDTAPRGAAGEFGIMQIMPGTWSGVDPHHQLDPNDPQQALMLAGTLINRLDGRFGKDTPASIAAYNGSGPKARAYAQRILGGKVPDSAFSTENTGSMTPQGIVQHGSQGPDAALKYMVQTAPQGMPMTDVWRHAEAQLVGAFISKGDMEGAQHARDFILQLSHAGSNQYLMAAHQALTAGNGTSAAQFLAKAHAFFPDGTIGRFYTDGKNVMAQRMDENDPTKQLGQSFKITAPDVAGMLNQTTDPNKYLTNLAAQQKANAQASYLQQHGQYFAGLAATRAGDAALRSSTSEANNIRNNDTKLQVAGINAAAKTPNHELDARIAKETSAAFGELATPDSTDTQRASMSNVYGAAVRMGATPPEALNIAHGLSKDTLKLIHTSAPDGRYSVVGQDGHPIGYLPKEVGDRYAAPQTAPGSPVGAAAASPAAALQMGAPNLAGSQPAPAASSALPVAR